MPDRSALRLPPSSLAVPAPPLPGFRHFGLGIDAQGIRNSIDIIKIGNNLDGIENITVAESLGAQRVQIIRTGVGGRARHLLGEFAQSSLAGRKSSAPVVVFNMLGQCRVTGLSTEILSVRLDSIEAAVRARDDGRHQLAVGAREA